MQTLKTHHGFLIFSTIVVAGAVAFFSLCLAAEFKKSKNSDVIVKGRQCYVPKSASFGLGIGALVCLCVAHFVGNFFIFIKFRTKVIGGGGGNCYGAVRKPTVSCILILLSWVLFVGGGVLIGAASSMSQAQPLGEGWVDGDCYVVKKGVYASSAVLGLLALGSTLGSAAITLSQSQKPKPSGRK
ncbi:protein MODIFYING WALL LIGNIN-2-like isoform X1 [Andrographis paniculata]|uniref:protein MODIFYING WALL LIGNIN-2-like isoform X1 n=1 Tax=Andrographis paniculata TaxID=175694 RepID=UPI0021E85900|nr:protein MODIFYING WALL LIGNIN-2-like isoform X1 [Andrographis paniculata]